MIWYMIVSDKREIIKISAATVSLIPITWLIKIKFTIEYTVKSKRLKTLTYKSKRPNNTSSINDYLIDKTYYDVVWSK